MERKWSIRAYREGDESKIFELWKAVYPAEGYNEEQWMRWWNWMYKNNPGGPTRIWLAEDNGKLVGQYPLIFMRLKVGNQIIKASQNIDQMTHPDYRYQGIASKLGKQALNEASSEGVHVTIGFANEASYVVDLKAGWVDVCAQRAMIRPLNLESILGKYITNKFLLKICTVSMNLIVKAFYRTHDVPKVGGLTITRISSFDDRINDLWDKVSRNYKIIVVRDKEYLNWRFVDVPDVEYAIFLAEKEGQILGYTVLKCEKQRGLIFGRIFELVVPLEQQAVAQSLILKAVEFSKEQKAHLVLYRVIANKVLYKTLRKSGFIYSRFIGGRAQFIARANTPEVSERFLRAPKHWFVQTGDSDAN